MSKLTIFFSDVFLRRDRLGSDPPDCKSLRSDMLMTLLSFRAVEGPMSAGVVPAGGAKDRSGPVMLIFLVFSPDNK